MKIKVLKDTKAASCPLGISVKDYVAGESYEIHDELAEVFISQGWGAAIEKKTFKGKVENKMIESAPENKSIEPVFDDVPEEVSIEEVASQEVAAEQPNKRGRKPKLTS